MSPPAVVLTEYLQSAAREGQLSWQAQQQAAVRFGCSAHGVELAALQMGLLPSRYQRNRETISPQGQLRLCQARVVVIGCGGLGGYLLELLARLGVGQLRAVDPDCFEEHNLNRQLFATIASLGQAKVEAARERLALVNPAVEMEALPCALTWDNAPELLQGAQVAVDALDNLATRHLLQQQCALDGLPLVHGAVAGWYGRLGTALPVMADESRCSGFQADDRQRGGLEQQLGNPCFTPALIAALQAAEVCKLLLGEGELLVGRQLWVDLLTMEFLPL